MVVLQVTEALFLRVGLVIGVQVAVRGLRLHDQADGAVRRLPQRGIRRYGKLIGDGFQPLIKIAVLKDHAVVFSPADPCREAEVFDAMAGLRILQEVVQRFPLVGKHLRPHQVNPRRKKAVGDSHAGQRQRLYHRFHSKFLSRSNLPGWRGGTGFRAAVFSCGWF